MTTMTTVLLPPPSLPPPLTSPLTSAAGVEAGARVTDALPMMLLPLLRARVAGATDTLAPVLPVVLAGAVGVVVVVVAVVVVVGHIPSPGSQSGTSPWHGNMSRNGVDFRVALLTLRA